MGGFYLPEDNDPDPIGDGPIFLTDSSARLRCCASFYGGTGKIREQFSFDYTLYFDLTRAEFFFEKDYYRHRWDADPAFLIRLKDVPGSAGGLLPFTRLAAGLFRVRDKNLEQLQFVFTDYSIPLISLEGYDIAGVCGIYERINQTGVRLTNMDILIARGFQKLRHGRRRGFSRFRITGSLLQETCLQ